MRGLTLRCTLQVNSVRNPELLNELLRGLLAGSEQPSGTAPADIGSRAQAHSHASASNADAHGNAAVVSTRTGAPNTSEGGPAAAPSQLAGAAASRASGGTEAPHLTLLTYNVW